jgi:hypothetical protein
MIHELDSTLETLIFYANALASEWEYKRFGEPGEREGYRQLRADINQARKLKLRLDQIDRLGNGE